ncbi:MAG: AbrB/MazE/SpoVT family DNA-binding domain-containing protein [Gammaproteobacteria bacterium]|nr:AbrB/MazE/SpoVT family DNA-binding domain-containing protein [Gammaproteobacteria bacterium]MYJ75783.1 AbrB/MazE/SpoVT family DNA-binding domain-containing protein [Gammaproteobacteria bacterium]
MATADLPAPGPRPTRLFRNGNSQAVRIPRALAFRSDKTQVEIERQGDELIIRPVQRRLKGLGSAFRELAPHFEDFGREQPPLESRDWEFRKPKP